MSSREFAAPIAVRIEIISVECGGGGMLAWERFEVHSVLSIVDSCGKKSFLKNDANQPLFGENLKEF